MRDASVWSEHFMSAFHKCFLNSELFMIDYLFTWRRWPFLLSCVANIKLSYLALAFSVFPHNVALATAVITFSVLEFRHDQTIAAATSSDATPIITDSLTSILPPPCVLREHIKRTLRPPEPPVCRELAAREPLSLLAADGFWPWLPASGVTV